MRPTGGTPAGRPSSRRCRLSTVRTLRRLGPATTGRVLGGRSRSAVEMTVQRTAMLSPVVPGCSCRIQACHTGACDLPTYRTCIPYEAVSQLNVNGSQAAAELGTTSHNAMHDPHLRNVDWRVADRQPAQLAPSRCRAAHKGTAQAALRQQVLWHPGLNAGCVLSPPRAANGLPAEWCRGRRCCAAN
jgi:hypothetical protein